MTDSEEREVAAEQGYVTMLYNRLDELRDRSRKRLSDVLTMPTAHNDQAETEREDFAAMHRMHGVRLDTVERGLCFGRIDLEESAGAAGGGEKLYIGRLGLFDEDYEPLLIDWRTPAAQPFYSATYADRQGVVLRRHIHTKGRVVTGLDDDVLDLEALGEGERTHLMGEAALLASLETGRTGRMSDIVATIQAEQDRIIRSDLHGVLVVEGGPGTGKTVVALHRAAYLLYNHRNWLSRRGVLVLGPNSTFMRYIDQVLPSLGETDVVLATVGELYPGVETDLLDSPEAAVVKGDLRMVDVVDAAVRARQWVPDDTLDIKTFDGQLYQLDRMTCLRARERTRRTELVHNRARRYLIDAILQELTEQGIDKVGREYAELFDTGSIRAELSQDPAVRAALDRLWPELTPQQVLGDLYTDPAFLAEAAPDLSAAERAALQRSDPYAWTVADVPLLDEMAKLLGDTDLAVFTAKQAAERAEAEAADAEAYARKITEEASEATWSEDEEKLVVTDTSLVAERYSERVVDGTIADRALVDREWEFGYAIVDEAQEMSPMAWRLLMRRCPGRSMTVVGDVAQTGAAEGARTWSEALDPFAAGEWRRERLSVNYRTPAEIMAVATDLLAATDPQLEAPTSVRQGSEQPRGIHAESPAVLADVVRHELSAIEQGTLAVIVPEGSLPELTRAVRAGVPEAATARKIDLDGRQSAGSARSVLDAPVAVLTSAEAKGLEFDAVVVVAPEQILAGSHRKSHGASDLYVALTRATRRLCVVYFDQLPPMLARLEQSEAGAG